MKKRSNIDKMKFSVNMAVLKNLQKGAVPKRTEKAPLDYPEWNHKDGRFISEEEYREFLSGLE